MTKEDIYEKLACTKLYVGLYNKEVQEKLLKLGYSWSGTKEIKYLNKPFMFIGPDSGKSLSYVDDFDYFRNHPYREITFKDILDLKETLRQFYNRNELLREMDKHTHFGWVQRKDIDYVDQITNIHDGEVIIGGDKVNFFYLFKYYQFLDGAPCGIVDIKKTN